MNIGIILAGGVGTRFGSNLPKQFVHIESKPLIVHTLEKFSNCNKIDKLFIVCLKSHIEEMKNIVEQYEIKKIEGIIPGGTTRHESIKNGINYLVNKGYDKTTTIIIHNANMPLVKNKNIEDCIKKCCGEVIVTTVAKCNGFFYQICDDTRLSIGPDRESIFHAKVPEAMQLSMACELYNDQLFNAKKYESYTAGMLGIIKNKKVEFSICDSTNMKITTKEDYELVETYLKNEIKGE